MRWWVILAVLTACRVRGDAVETCADGVLSGDETAIDCGGACGPCADGLACVDPVDCASGVCDGGVCLAPTCADGVRNGTEGDVDCGGAGCDPCGDGDACNGPHDCASGVCDGGVCAAPTCVDGVRNGDETDLDCGAACDPCADGLACEDDGDCASGACVDGACVDPSCTDGVVDGTETGLDCGGDCPACPPGQPCDGADDCATGVCDAGFCQLPRCDDGVPNGAETDTDCGGDCPACDTGLECDAPADCASGVCSGTCADDTCTDTVRNGDETHADCGGSCPGCDPGEGCVEAGDCVEGVCDGTTCLAARCDDGVRNGLESGIDCGGLSACGPCGPDRACTVPGDCVSGVCDGDVCRAPTCTDLTSNGGETGTDCGGPCDGCAPDAPCVADDDCISLRCGPTSHLCLQPTCTDGVHNGPESDADCGGGCAACPTYAGCVQASDCVEGVCTDGICREPTCVDQVHNGLETSTDCGGGCPGCGADAACRVASDCADGVCSDGACALPSCDDRVANGDETDRDCGGPDCDACWPGSDCAEDDDCREGVCDPVLLACAPPACDDDAPNGAETDEDCGGPDCPACDDGLGCRIDADCGSGVCDVTCQAASCDDGVRNGGETDVDCGGACEACWWDVAWDRRAPLDVSVTAFPQGAATVQVPVDVDTLCYGFTLPPILYSFHFEGGSSFIESSDGHAVRAPLDHGGQLAAGHEGLGYDFDGNDWVELPDIVPTTHTVTVAGWFRRTGAPVGNPYLIGGWKDGEVYKIGLTDSGCNSGVTGGPRLFGEVHPVGQGEPNLCASLVTPVDAWTFAALTFDQRFERFYVDGAVQDTVDFGAARTLSSFSDIELGTDRDHAAFFRGVMDDVLLLDGALTGPQVAALMSPSCKRDLSDLRVHDATTDTLLPYWVESDARIWVRVPVDAAQHELFVYHGNPAAEPASSGADTFELFDAFDALSGAWTASAFCESNTLTASLGAVRATANCNRLTSVPTFDATPRVLAFDTYREGPTNHGCWDFHAGWATPDVYGALRYDQNGIDGVGAGAGQPCGDQASVPGGRFDVGTLRFAESVDGGTFTARYEALGGSTATSQSVTASGTKGAARLQLAAHANTPRYVDNVRVYAPSTATVTVGAPQSR